MLAHANLIVTARQDGRLVGFARSLTDFCFCCYLSDLAVDKACQGQGIGKRLIEETRKAAGGPLTTTLLLSAPTAMTFYQGIKMPQADNASSTRREQHEPDAAHALHPFITWPRISPPLLAAVWTLKYHLPAARSAAWASVSVASPLIGLASAPFTGTTTPALVLASAGPWKCAAVAGPLRSL